MSNEQWAPLEMINCLVRARLPAVHCLWVLTRGLVAHFAERHPGLCCIFCILGILCILYQLVTRVPTVLCPPRQLDATELCPGSASASPHTAQHHNIRGKLPPSTETFYLFITSRQAEHNHLDWVTDNITSFGQHIYCDDWNYNSRHSRSVFFIVRVSPSSSHFVVREPESRATVTKEEASRVTERIPEYQVPDSYRML